MTALLGYLGYAFVVGFCPLQLFEAIKGRTLNLGLLPLISLVLGLALLQVSFVLAGVIPYIVGNGLGLVFSTALLGIKTGGVFQRGWRCPRCGFDRHSVEHSTNGYEITGTTWVCLRCRYWEELGGG